MKAPLIPATGFIMLLLTLTACGGGGRVESSPAASLPRKGGIYVGKTSQGKPVLLHVSVSSKKGMIEINWELPRSCTDREGGQLDNVRISASGQILDHPPSGYGGFEDVYGIHPGGVLGTFASESLAKGELPEIRGACGAPATTWEARLEQPGSHTPDAQERQVARKLNVSADQVRCLWEGSGPEAPYSLPVDGCYINGKTHGRCYEGTDDVTAEVRRSTDTWDFLCDD